MPKYRTFACFVCCRRFKKYSSFSGFAHERGENRLLSLKVLSSYLGVPVEPVYSAAAYFKSKESWYCRNCGKWFKDIVVGSTIIDAETLEREILKLQNALLMKLKQLHESSLKIKEGVDGIKAILDKTEQEGPVLCMKGINDVDDKAYVDTDGIGQKELPERVWRLRQSLLKGTCGATHEAEERNEKINETKKRFAETVDRFPKQYLIPVDRSKTKIEHQIESAQAAEGEKGVWTKEENVEVCPSPVYIKEELTDEECDEGWEEQDDFAELSSDMTLHEKTLKNVNAINLTNLEGMMSSDSPEIPDGQSDDEFPEPMEEDDDSTCDRELEDIPGKTVSRSRRRNTQVVLNSVNKRKTELSSSSESDSDISDHDPDFQITEESKAERRRIALEKRTAKDVEALKEYNMYMGDLEPTDNPSVMTWKGVDIIVKEGGAMQCGLCHSEFIPKYVTAVKVTRLIRQHICKAHLDGLICRICESKGKERKFPNYRCLLKHLNVHECRQRATVCDICGKPFRDPFGNAYLWHVWSHKNAEEQEAEIRKGVKPPKRPNAKIKRREPGVVGKFLCSECGKDFMCKSSLDSHKRCHMSKEERNKTRTPCPECGKMYLPEYLSAHIRQVHRRILPVQNKTCNFENCGKTFVSESRLLIHQQNQHTKQFRFNCHCGKGFATRCRLNAHAVCHTTGKPYSCDLCSVSYKHIRNLVRHKTLSHKGEIDPLTGQLIS